MSQQYRGTCFCGAVAVEATGTPVAMGYCHCASCRHWSAGPVNAFSLWSPDAVRVTQGVEQLGSYQKTPNSLRKWCRSCGGHVLTEHPELGLIDIYAALLPDLPFEPALHVHYQEAVLRVADGLPKLRDVPAEMGGSGETLPE
ncbi:MULTISPECIES: GFA family protein [Halomonas]|jgi:hypothetical protein|uniref:GFA family protein n=1 Tax=Halomonas TaxID=2745 RepID=UPI0020B84854|nr:GFA family protein [Halomonas sp. 3H]